MLHIPQDLPLVQHLLTSWQPAWQPRHSLPHTHEQALVGLETGIYCGTTASQCETRQTLYQLSYGFTQIAFPSQCTWVAAFQLKGIFVIVL